MPDDKGRLKMIDRRKDFRNVLVAIVVIFAIYGAGKLSSWGYTTYQIARAPANGFYPTAEEAMRHLIEQNYVGIKRIDIFSAGPNSPDGRSPHVWYVTAEVRALSRADGSEMGRNGCDNPGRFFLQTHEGWFPVSEGAFPGLLGNWMKEYGLAGPGESKPSTDAIGGRPSQSCLTP
jgi:hypothetical protein